MLRIGLVAGAGWSGRESREMRTPTGRPVGLRALAAALLLVGPAMLGGKPAAAARAGDGAPAPARPPLRVVTTTTDLRALVEAVGGDRVVVESLLAGAQDPHHFEAKPRQIAAVRAADMLVRIGIGHEEWLGRLLRQAGNPKVAPGAPGHVDTSRGIVDVLEPVARTAEKAGHSHAFGNPHYWLDPENAKPMTRIIADALAGALPADRGLFERRRAAFVASLDERMRRWVETLAPYRGIRVVAVHDSFPYLARRFGFTVAGYVEPQPGIPPTPAHLARLVGQMRSHGIRVILTEAWLPDDAASRVAEAAGAKVIKLPTSVDSGPGTQDYLSLFDRITEALAAGLAAAGVSGAGTTAGR